MAQIHVDTEIMLHMMPAQAITEARRFTAVHDEDHNIMLFSISSTGEFLSIKSDGHGNNIIVNISDALSIDGAAQAFAVSQGADAAGLLYLAFATDNKSGGSDLHVFSPLHPKDLDLPADQLKVKLLPSLGTYPAFKIVQLHMNRVAGQTYPLLVSVFSPTKDEIDIARIAVTSANWTWSRDLDIPEIAKNFIGIATGTLALGDGVFILYATLGTPTLFFTTSDPGYKFTVDLKFPSTAKPSSIATFADERGRSCVLVGGGGLYYLSAAECTQSGTVAKRISEEPYYDYVENLYVSQAGTSVSAWFETSDHMLGYQKGFNNGTLDGEVVPLLPAGENAEYAPLIDADSKSQLLVVLDGAFQLSILEQSVETQIWNRTPFLVAQMQEMTELSAFVSHIELTDARGWGLGAADFLLSATAWVTVLINGLQYNIGPAGRKVTTGASGTLTLIVPSDDLSCCAFTLKDVPGSSHLPAQGFVINPTQKVQERLAAVKTGDDLRNAKTTDGRLLLEGSDATPGEVDAAAKLIKDLTSISGDLPQQPPPLARVVGGLRTSAVTANSVLDVAWEWWEWVRSQVTRVAQGSIEKVKGIWRFTITLADMAWSFALDSVHAVSKAATFVFDKIKVAFENVIGFFGWLFNWQDITRTRDSIKVMINAGLEFGAVFIITNRNKLEGALDDLEQKLIGSTDPGVPSDEANKEIGPETESEGGSGDESATRSAPANVGTYHFDQAKNAPDAPVTESPTLATLYAQTIEPLITSVSEAAGRIAADIVQLFDRSQNMSMTDVLKQLGVDVLRLFFGILKSLILALMDLGADVVLAIRDILNAPVELPVITPLLRRLGVPDFSFLDAIALVLAIPVTVLAKALTGDAPKRIQSFDYTSMVNGTLDRPSQLAYNELASYLDITYKMVHALTKVYDIFTAEAPKPKTFSYASLVVDLIVRLGTFPYDTETPGREYRIAAWSVLSANVILQAACLKAQVKSTKVLAVADIFVAVMSFALTQVVHGYEFTENYPQKDDTVTGLSLASSVFGVIAGVAGGYGVLAVDPLSKTGAAIVVAAGGACLTVIDTGKSAITIEKEHYNYISGNV